MFSCAKLDLSIKAHKCELAKHVDASRRAVTSSTEEVSLFVGQTSSDRQGSYAAALSGIIFLKQLLFVVYLNHAIAHIV